MKKVIILLALFVAAPALAFYLKVPPSTQYTDGTSIEPTIGIFIDAWVDGVPLATMFPQTLPATKIPLIDNTFGVTHSYKVRWRLSDGRVSDNEVATLQSPFDPRQPKAPDAPLSIGN